MKMTTDGRIAFCLVAALLAGSAGCVTTRDDKSLSSGALPEGKLFGRRGDRKPGPAVALEFAKLRREQSDAVKNDPEVQRRFLDSSRIAYREALKSDPNNLEAMRGLAQIYVRQSDYERAFDAYRKAQAKHPKDAGLYLEVAMLHNRRKEWNEAQNCCQKALELEPENRQAQSMYGLTLARAGQYDRALPYLTRAGGAAQAHYNLARMQVHLGQTDLARQHLAIALRENPNLQSAQDLVARLDTGNDSGIVQTHATTTQRHPAP